LVAGLIDERNNCYGLWLGDEDVIEQERLRQNECREENSKECDRDESSLRDAFPDRFLRSDVSRCGRDSRFLAKAFKVYKHLVCVFRRYPTSDSERIRPVIPKESDH